MPLKKSGAYMLTNTNPKTAVTLCCLLIAMICSPLIALPSALGTPQHGHSHTSGGSTGSHKISSDKKGSSGTNGSTGTDESSGTDESTGVWTNVGWITAVTGLLAAVVKLIHAFRGAPAVQQSRGGEAETAKPNG
jgi:hypothetical protein